MFKWIKKNFGHVHPEVIRSELNGEYTPIKLWSTETIGVDNGYFECKREQIAIEIRYIKNEIDTQEFNRLMDNLERKYFGPKWVKGE